VNPPGSFVSEALARPAPRVAPPGPCADALAWQRAMERASALAVAAPVQPFAAALAAPRPHGDAVEAAANPSAADGPCTEPCGRTRTAVLCAADHDVRLHAERQGDAVHVWLGLSAPDQAWLPALLPALSREVVALGLRLRSVVCNGQVVFHRHGAAPREASRDPPSLIDVVLHEET